MNVLETERLLIRSLTMDDLETLHRLLDEDMEWGGPGVSIDQRRERLQFQIALARWPVPGCVYGDRAIVLKGDGQLIGICGFRPWMCTFAERTLYESGESPGRAFAALELGVGYALSSGHRGRGYATEAVKALVEYGFRELKIQRIVALTERGNVESVGVMKRLGMRIGINPDDEAVYPWVVGIIENGTDLPGV